MERSGLDHLPSSRSEASDLPPTGSRVPAERVEAGSLEAKKEKPAGAEPAPGRNQAAQETINRLLAAKHKNKR